MTSPPALSAASGTPDRRRHRAWALPAVMVLVAGVVLAVALWPRGDAGPPALSVVASGATPAALGEIASVYLLIDDAGGADRLLSASSPDAATVTLHQTLSTSDRGDLMVDLSSLEVPEEGRLALVPGGDHLMLHHVYEPLEPGDVVSITVVFERSGPVTVAVPVQPLAELADLTRLG